MANRLDLTGQRFGRLTVIGYKGQTGAYQAMWLCRCDCGRETVVSLGGLRSGRTQSCGCLQRERCAEIRTKHGNARKGAGRARLYHVWDSMKARCLNPRSSRYENYGGRGITVCPEWMHFEPFRDWALANGYTRGLTIDRINNDGNYEPANCRWADRKVQSRNRRGRRLITYQGQTRPLYQWAEALGIAQNVLSTRLRRGWAIDRAFNQHVREASKCAH